MEPKNPIINNDDLFSFYEKCKVYNLPRMTYDSFGSTSDWLKFKGIWWDLDKTVQEEFYQFIETHSQRKLKETGDLQQKLYESFKGDDSQTIKIKSRKSGVIDFFERLDRARRKTLENSCSPKFSKSYLN
jgi:TRAP-type C4-dicarboxylate transport system substrate-binding protein